MTTEVQPIIKQALTVVVASRKGGVAKTTTTVSLAHYLALAGYNTLIVDRDSQRNTLRALNLQSDDGEFPEPAIYATGRDNLQILPAGDSDVYLPDLVAYYDAILVDMPPNDFVEQTTLPYADIVIIPASLEVFGLDGVRLTMETINKFPSSAPVYILPTIYNKKSGLHAKNLAKLIDLYDGDVAPKIYYSGFIPTSQEKGKTIYEFNHVGLDDVRYGYNTIGGWIESAIHNKKVS